MIKLNQDTKDHPTESLIYTNPLKVNLSTSPSVLVACDKKVYKEVLDSFEIPILKPETLIVPERKVWETITDTLGYGFNGDSVSDYKTSYLNSDVEFYSNFKKSNENILDTISELSLSNDSFQNHYEDTFNWSESDCSLTQLLSEPENVPCVTTGKEERDQIDGIEFISFETENDLIEYTKVELDFKGVAAASQSDDGLEMLDDGSFSDFNSSHTIIPTKTNDITKIKGWKNKRFALTLNSDDDSRTSQKSDDGYDDGFESSYMRNAEEASSEDRESTKMSDKLELLDPTDGASNTVETESDLNDEISTSVSQNDTLNLTESDIKSDPLPSENLLNLKKCSTSSSKIESTFVTLTEDNLQATSTVNGTNPLYKRRVSQSLIDSIANKINYNFGDEEQSPPKRMFSETFSAESDICPNKKPMFDKPVMADHSIFPKELEETPSNSKSAFVSDVLENFLKSHSKLNIHYELANLKAAENITHSEEDLMINLPEVITQTRITKKPVLWNGPKPKTLAEKRRMLKDGILQAKKRNIIGERSKSEASTSKANSVAGKRKRSKGDMVKLNNECKGVVNTLDQDFVQTTKSIKTEIKEEKSVYNKKRFRHSLRKQSGIEDNGSPTSNSLEQNKKTGQKYIEIKPKNKFNDNKKKFKKPYFGPHGEIQNCYPVNLKRRVPNNLNIKSCPDEEKLCHEYIISPTNLKDKVGMILHVGLGRPLYEEAAHNLELLKGDKKEISEGFASFAVSAVVPNGLNGSVDKGTKILVPVVCRKLIDLISKSNPKSKPNLRVKNNITLSKNNTSLKKNIIASKNQQKTSPTKIMESTNDIRHVMNDMLQYISNRDLFTHQKYNFDPDVPITKDINKKTCDSDAKNVLKTNKQKDKSKLNSQLKKIGVTFIDITEETKQDESSEDSSNETKICSKEFCKLGCICDSLKVKDRMLDHCRRVVCMFKCKCNKSMLGKGIVEIKSRLWFSANVMQIQHKRELNLAKEEREYHQTVIRSNDKVILMSTGRKREIKVPLKYRDSEVFLGKDISIEQIEKEINFTTNTDTGNTKINKKISLDEQKKKGTNKAPIDQLEKRTSWEIFYDISPCSVVLDKIDISKKNGMSCKSPILKSKNRRRRRNVAVKRTAAITMNNSRKRPSNKVTTTATDDAIIFVEDSSEEEGQNEQVLGKIDNVFSLKNQKFSENFSADIKLLHEQSEEHIISNNANNIVNKDNERINESNVCMNESTAPLPKILAPSRYLVVELVDHLFTVLRYKKYGLMVSYRNLKEAIHQAELSNKTIRIIFPTQNKKAGFNSSKYGAYAVPGFKRDMIFFGPYELNEDHGLHGLKVIDKSIITIPFIKKDAHERRESGIRYLWWEKKFQKSVMKQPTEKIKNVNRKPTATVSRKASSDIKRSVKQQKVKQKTKKIKHKKTKPKRKAGNAIADQLSKISITNLPLSENESEDDQPLSKILSKIHKPLSEESVKNKQIPLIRVRSDLMAVNPPKEEQIKEGISENVEKSRENETATVLDNHIPNKYFRKRKKRKIDSEKTSKRHEEDSSLIETVVTDPQESGTVDEISDSNANEESDGDLDVFLYQPIGAVLTDDYRKTQVGLKYDLDERLYKDPLELDSDEPLPEAALLCLTPGIGYLPIVTNYNREIIIRDPVDRKVYTLPGVREASIILNKSFKKKMTFDPKDVELKWLLVKFPIIKRLRPFDRDILNNRSLIVTEDGVVEEHTHAINIEKNLKERRRRKQLFNLAKELGKLFLTEDQLRKVSLKGILDAAISIIQRVIEISVNFVSILNHEKSKKKRLQSKLKVLRAEHCLKIYQLRVKARKEKNKDKQNGSEQVIKSAENIQTTDNPGIVTLDNDIEDVVPISSSPDNVRMLTPVNQKPWQRPKEVIEITVSSDDETREEEYIDISDSDSIEITCISNQDPLARTTPITPETSFTGYITPPKSSPSVTKSAILKPVTSILSSNLKQIEMDSNTKMVPATIRAINQLPVEQPKPNWYVVPEEPPPPTVPTFDPLPVNVTTVPINTFQLTRKTVLVRQNEHGGVELTRPPQNILPISPEARFSPLTRPQSLLYKIPSPGKIILNKSPSSTVVGTVSVDRVTNKPLIITTEPVVTTTSTLFQTGVKDCSKLKRVLLSSSSSLLKNSVFQGKPPISISSQNLQHTNRFLKIDQPFRVSPSSKSEILENSSSDDNDSSGLSPDKFVLPLKTNLLNKDNLHSNVSTDVIPQRTKSPSSSPGGETSSDAITDSSNVEKTVTKERDHQIDSVVLKGPKLRYPKQHNSASKGVKVLRPVEKH